jgi:hypothetical protein
MVNLIVAVFIVLASFGIENSPKLDWNYTGPDVTSKTLGPIYVDKRQLQVACQHESYRTELAGCFVPHGIDGGVIYIRSDFASRNTHLCRLPNFEPISVEEHEWCHAKGWGHENT